MDPISNVDGLVLLLRQRLLERSRMQAAGRKEAAREKAPATATRLDAVHAMASVDDVDDRQLGRALVQSLLVDRFGTELVNDAAFQQVISRVTDTIEHEPQAAKLLAGLVAELRASAR